MRIRILVDTGSSADIIFKSTVERMEINPSQITRPSSPLHGLSGEVTMTLGSINLCVKAGSVEKGVEFLVVDRPGSYNAIIRTSWMNSMQAVPSTYHLCLKYRTLFGIETIYGDLKASQVCFASELKRKSLVTDALSKKKQKSTSVKESLAGDETKIFWQIQKTKALDEKREPTCEPIISVMCHSPRIITWNQLSMEFRTF